MWTNTSYKGRRFTLFLTPSVTLGTFNFITLATFQQTPQTSSWYLAPSEDIGAGPALCNDLRQWVFNLK